VRLDGALLVLTLSLLLALAGCGGSTPNYSFTVEQNISHVYINRDGSIDIEYHITFDNLGDPIDVVDIGLPHDGYRLDTATADVNSFPVTDIRRSGYIAVGVEVHLGEHAIPRGQKSTLNFRINNPKMVFPDTEDPAYASMEFSPTWFYPPFVVGTTRVEVHVHFPPGVSGHETKYHAVRPTYDVYAGDRLVFTWVKEAARQEKLMVGVSFPRKYVDKVFDPSDVTFVESMEPTEPFDWAALAGWLPYIVVASIVVLGGVGGAFANRAKRMHYLPPETRIEGLGPCKELDPIEAAIVMELPLSRIVALCMMQLIQKGCIEVKQVRPLRVNILRSDAPGLKAYEESILKALEPAEYDDEKTRQRRLQNAMTKLIESVRDKLKKGYSRDATEDYYRGTIGHMWNRIEKDPQLEHLTWIALNDDYVKEIGKDPAKQEKLEPVWRDGFYNYFPSRYRRRNMYYVFDDFEREIVPDNTRLTHGVSKVTNPKAWIQSSGWSSGGGGGGFSCACACAGCACACAGGGR
jgi:hypothetical protein